jgi:hypothetical protein
VFELGNEGDNFVSPDSENQNADSKQLGNETRNGKIILKAVNVQGSDAGTSNGNEDVPTPS